MWAIGFVSAPLVVFISSKVYGNSVTGVMGKINGVLYLFYSCLFFTVGKLGVVHLTWALPLAYLVGRVNNSVMVRIVSRPLAEIIKNVNLLSQGILNISVDKKLEAKKK